MARRNHTYAIRLAVEGGGRVKAELVSVGQSGEQSLNRIEAAGGRASGGLKGLGHQAELLRAGVRTLGVAPAGVTTVGGSRRWSTARCRQRTRLARPRTRSASASKRCKSCASPPRRRASGPDRGRHGARHRPGEPEPMTGFHEVRLPDNIAYGATGGSEFATTVVATSAGHEKRNVNWAEARGRWDVASGLKKQAQLDELIAFFRARRGKAYGFRFKDWTDYRAKGQLLGTGDDSQTQFQLVKHYPSGSVSEVRTVTKPVAGAVKIYLDGVEQIAGWSVDTTTGLVTFGTAPDAGAEVTADFEFDVPVRFDTDHMAVTIETYRLHTWQQIPIVEVRA